MKAPTSARPIQPIGGFFPMDEEGHVLNPADKNTIPQSAWPVLEEIIKQYRLYFKEQLHSVWLRGSLARGIQTQHSADMDVFALIDGDMNKRWANAPWADTPEWNAVGHPIGLQSVEMMISHYQPRIDPFIAMLIKTQSCCIAGEDISDTIAPVYPSKTMMLNYRWIKADLKAFLAIANPDQGALRQITKVMIRTGFELVMEKIKRYTPDLFWCWVSFARYYPNWSAKMRLMVELYLNPGSYTTSHICAIEYLGNWLVGKVEEDLL